MWALLKRNLTVLKRSWHHMLLADVLDNFIWLSIFAYGFASYMPDVKGLPYQQFIIPGYFLLAGLYQLGMEATHRFYAKLVHNPWWVSLLSTPLGVKKMLYSEVFWVVLRGSFPVFAVLVLAYLFGFIVNLYWFLMGMPLVFCLYFVYAAISMNFTLFIKNDENFVYYWVLFFSPIFLASGALYDNSKLPETFQYLIKFYPVSYVTEPLQNVMLWGQVNAVSYIALCSTLIVLGVLAICLCEHQFKKRFLQ